MIPYLPDGVDADLRTASNIRFQLQTELTRIQNRISRWFNIYFPEYKTVYGKSDAKSGMLVLKMAPLPEDILTLCVDGVNQIWRDAKLRAVGIKGVGIKTVSGFLAEVRDISRFNTPKELQKLAGWALVENSSEKHKGRTTISRRGRKRLRYLLFEVAMSLVAKNAEFRELHVYYTTRKLNLLKKM